MRRLGVAVLSLLLLACPGRKSPSDDAELGEEASSRVVSEREGAGITKMIQESQRQGLVGQDLEAFMRIWAKDARLVLGRGVQPGPYDEVVPIARVEGYWKRRGFDGQVENDVSFKREQHKVKGDRAEVTWDTTIRETHRENRAVVLRVERERWLLRRGANGWRVYENRVWPVSIKRAGDARVVYDASQWARLDAVVDQAKTTSSVDELLPALYAAHRFGEGHDAAVQATQEAMAAEAYWFWRAAFAMNLYFIDEALMSFQRQLMANPDATIPRWAMPLPTKRAPNDPDAGL